MNELQLNNIFTHTHYNEINEDTFWTIVNELKWYETSKELTNNSVDFITHFLSTRFTVEELSELQRIEVEKRDAMENFIKSYVSTSPSEERETYKLNADETHDLASYIVGMGRTMYSYIKDNPKLIYDLQNRYVACFEDGFDRAIYAINFAKS